MMNKLKSDMKKPGKTENRGKMAIVHQDQKEH